MENLVSELKIKLFEYCLGSLKDLCLVSKEFQKIITSSELMKNLPLILESKRKEKFESIIKSQRKFQKIIIRYDYHFGEKGMKIIKNFGGSLKHLKIVRCIFSVDQFVSSFRV
jgi:hypothetical protein